MSIPRRFTKLSLMTLVVVSSSVFLFGDTANAQSLTQNEQVIEQQKKKVEKKSDKLGQTSQEVQSLQQKREALAAKLEEEKKTIEELNRKIAEKKAAAEAEAKRVEELKTMFVHVTVPAPNSAGNSYAAGNCTFYAKSRRPDLPNNLGNANTWYANALAQGFNVGMAPQKGCNRSSSVRYACGIRRGSFS